MYSCCHFVEILPLGEFAILAGNLKYPPLHMILLQYLFNRYQILLYGRQLVRGRDWLSIRQKSTDCVTNRLSSHVNLIACLAVVGNGLDWTTVWFGAAILYLVF